MSFNIRGHNEGPIINFKPPSGAPAGRVRIRRPGRKGISINATPHRPLKNIKRDDFGMSSDEDDTESDVSSKDISDNSDDDDGDEEPDNDFSALANQDRLLSRDERRAPAPPPPPQRHFAPPLRHPPQQSSSQPDYMHQAADDGFIGAEVKGLDQQKLELLHSIQRMAASGNPPQVSLSMDSSYEQISQEYRRIKKNAEIMRSIKFQRRVLLAVSTGVEFISKKATFVKLKLDGFSESVLDSIADYDQAFEEVHEKYGESISMDPMYSVLFMFISSIVAYHISNSLFSTVLPSVSQTLSNNPEVLKQVTEAMKNIQPNAGTQQTQAASKPVVDKETRSEQHIAQQMSPPLGFPSAPPPSVFAQGFDGPEPPRATRINTIEEHFTQPSMPPLPRQDDDTRSISVVSDGGTRTRVRRGARKPPAEDTLVL